ncbi:beta-propeller fold lactonase family protein [Rhodoferax sp. GW822-FHT02A01]|uniref:lactonase family protein n=1 Tax=Rhodoferax sp. GW822-FHT02A01 TaxID=3141537 RepID=UPI00315D1AE1
MQFSKLVWSTKLRAVACFIFAVALIGCGGGGGASSSSSGGGASTQGPSKQYGFSGTLTGLTANQKVVITNTNAVSGGVTSTILTSSSPSSQNFVLPSTDLPGTPYNFTVSPQSYGSTCSISNGSGIMTANDVTNIAINCSQTQPSKFEYVANFGDNTISAYSINTGNGALTAVSGSPFTAGTNPVSMVIDNSNKFVFVANSTSNNVTAYKIDSSTGALTQVTGSPFAAGANPISIAINPTGQYVYVANRGGSGSVTAYSINSTTGVLTPITGSPYTAAANPQSLIVDPAGNYLYVANAVSSVSVFSINSSNGTLSEISGSPFAATSILSHITIDPTGAFLYAATTNSPTSSITGYSIDNITGKLTLVSSGPFASGNWTMGLTIDPSGNYMYAADFGNNSISAFSINRTSGLLTSIASSPFLTAGGSGPESIAFDVSSNFVYITDISGGVLLYSYNSATGALTSVSRYAAGNSPAFIAITH